MTKKAIKVDVSAFGRFAKDLRILREREFPYAVRNAINGAAFKARGGWDGQIKKQLTLRNTFTQRSLRVEKASGRNINGMRAVLGSIAPYMGDTEEGATQVFSGHVGYAVPTRAAAGEPNAPKRVHRVKKNHYLKNIRMGARLKRGPRKQRNAASIAMAIRKGFSYVLLTSQRGRVGIFKIIDPGKPSMRVRMIFDLSKRTTHAKPKPTLHDALAAMREHLPAEVTRAVREQLRMRVFGLRSVRARAGK